MQIIPNLVGTATVPPGSIDLGKYPALVYAPGQHGEGVRFAHNGRPVEDIIAITGTLGDGASETMRVTDHVEYLSYELGVSFADVCDALKYLRDQKKI